MRRLKMLLPKASPAARSGSLYSVIELTPRPNSGSEVAVASNTTPMNDLPSPVLIAMTSADFARKVEATRMIAAAPSSWSHSRATGYSFFVMQKMTPAVPGSLRDDRYGRLMLRHHLLKRNEKSPASQAGINNISFYKICLFPFRN